MMVKRGGGVAPPPELIFLGGLAVSGLAMYFHPSKPERKATVLEKVGLLWHRRKNKKNIEQKEGGK